MKSLNIKSTELLKAISVVAPIVKDKTTLPILSNLLFESSEGKLKITASNGEIRSSVSIDIDSDETFSFCVSKNVIVNILSSLSDVSLVISIDKSKLSISSSFGVYDLPTEDALLFPKQEDMGDLNSFNVDTEEFISGLKKSIPFVDTLTENLNRVLIKSEKKKLSIAGLSNACFYEKQFDYNGDDISVSLTTDSAKYLCQVIDLDSDLLINYNATFFCVYFDDISIEMVQLASNPPMYKKILDAVKKENNLKIDRELLLSCVKRFSAICDKDSKAFVFNISKDKISISYKNDLLNHKANEELTDFTYSGVDLSIGLNINKFKTVLSTLEYQEVDMFLSDSNYPALLVEENTRIIISPMKI